MAAPEFDDIISLTVGTICRRHFFPGKVITTSGPDCAREYEGRPVVGLKVALTSAEARMKVGVDRPVWGWLTDEMAVGNGHIFDASEAGVMRAEAELVFELGEDLRGPGITRGDVLGATTAIRAGIELPRRARTTPTSGAEMIGLNSLAKHFLVGEGILDFAGMDLPMIEAVITVNSHTTCSGRADAVMGHPADAVATVVNDLANAEGRYLHAGELIFSGSITPPVDLAAGMTIEADFTNLGRIGVSVADRGIDGELR